MPTLFTKVTDDEGNEVYQEVDVTEVVKSHELYTGVKDEAIKNRLALKEAKTALEQRAETPEPAQPAQPVDLTQIRDEILQEVLSTIKNERTQEQQREAVVTELMNKHKLPPNMRGILSTHPNPEQLAIELERANVQVADDRSNPSPADRQADVMAKVDKILGLNNP